jgi:hypothetical protein
VAGDRSKTQIEEARCMLVLVLFFDVDVLHRWWPCDISE